MILLFILIGVCYPDVEEVITKSRQALFIGDMDSAINILQKGHKEFPESTKIKDLLAKLLTKKAKQLLKKDKKTEAIPLLEKAAKLGLQEAENLYTSLKPKPKEEPKKEKPPVEKKVVKKPPKRPKEIQKIIVIEKKKPEKKELGLRKRILARLEKTEKKPEKKLPASYLGLGMIILLCGSVLIAGFYLITRAKREKELVITRTSKFERYQRMVMEMLEEKGMMDMKDKKIIVNLSDTKEQYHEIVVIAPEARKRAKRVEIIEQALKDETDPLIGENMFSPFLKDPNNRVRGNAAKAIYRFNRNLALETLRDMIESGDKWMILSACWALGEIKDPIGVKLLAPILKHSDPHIRRRASMALDNILANKKAEEMQELQRQINKILKRK